MSLAIGTRFASYLVTAQIGAGGMGEVYRASDVTLNRDVALKVLPDAFAADPDRLARFTREARTLAALNHPHIAQIYGFEQSGSTQALVLEFVEGETLAERLERAPLSIDDALQIAEQIADALEAAHEQGIVHRDLKPSNIKLRGDGVVKVLDFGLARAREPLSSAAAAPAAATITSPADITLDGKLRGTPSYMSPEQASGNAADERSDLWAFGVVLMEMLTGRRVFGGQTTSRILTAVLEHEPDWKRLPPNTPRSIRTLLRRCLEKDRRRRLDSAVAARLEIEDALKQEDDVSPRASLRREATAWIAAGLLAVATVALGVRVFRSAPAIERHPQKLSLLAPIGASVNRDYVALSPNGRFVAFVASTTDKHSLLWIRALDELTARPLPGTDEARLPFWSPDSRFVGFFAERKLKKIQLAGGPVQIICDAPYGFGGTWNRSGVIVFSPDFGTPLSRVAADGGVPQPATAFDAAHTTGSAHLAPAFLPDGRHFLYVSQGSQSRSIELASLDSPASLRLVNADSMAVYAHTPGAPDDQGFLVYVRDNALLAQQFDARTMAVTGEALPVGDGEMQVMAIGATAPFSVSDTGMLAYRSFTANTQLVWVDRAGKRLGILGAPERYNAFELAPDGRRAAVERTDPRTRRPDIWLMDLFTGTSEQFTFTGGEQPRWSPDGQTVTFDRRGQIIRKRIAGSTTEELMFSESNGSPFGGILSDWSPDGATYVIRATEKLGGGSQDGKLWLLPARAGARPRPIAQAESRGFNGRFSPDGKWLAYTSNETGINEVYVQPVANTGTKWKISQNGGIRPSWSRNGGEIFFVATSNINGAGMLMSVSVELTQAVHIGAPRAIVELPFVPRTANNYPYGVTPGGKRILTIQPMDDSSSAAITLILDWPATFAK